MFDQTTLVGIACMGTCTRLLAYNEHSIVRRPLFAQDKRLGAGIIDGRSIWRDDGTASKLLAALRAKLGADQPISVQVGGGVGWVLQGPCGFLTVADLRRGLCSDIHPTCSRCRAPRRCSTFPTTSPPRPACPRTWSPAWPLPCKSSRCALVENEDGGYI